MMGKLKIVLIVALAGLMSGESIAVNSRSSSTVFSEEQVAEGLKAEAQHIVEGFISEFPNTLEAMPDNPYRDQMDRVERLLKDSRFYQDMVGVAREILYHADIVTILKARYQGVRDKKYFKEIMRVSLLFADVVAPMILEKLDSPDSIRS
jgi:hypothetical protein